MGIRVLSNDSPVDFFLVDYGHLLFVEFCYLGRRFYVCFLGDNLGQVGSGRGQAEHHQVDKDLVTTGKDKRHNTWHLCNEGHQGTRTDSDRLPNHDHRAETLRWDTHFSDQ